MKINLTETEMCMPICRRSPKCILFYGPGWLRITPYVTIKILLFVLIIIKMDVGKLDAIIYPLL